MNAFNIYLNLCTNNIHNYSIPSSTTVKFVVPTSSSMGGSCHGALLDVCVSVVLSYVCLCLRRLFSAFSDTVLIYGRWWLRRLTIMSKNINI